MKMTNVRIAGLAFAALAMAVTPTVAQARGGGFGGGAHFVPHFSPRGAGGFHGGNFGNYGRGFGGGGRRFGGAALGLGILGAGALGYGLYNYGGYANGYAYPYEDACTRATGNPYRCDSYQYGY